MLVSRRRIRTLSIAIGDVPPTEFRIFRAGPNETTKGVFLFDSEAARLVMAEFDKHGIDLMLDLEHLSIDQDAPNYDPDARGWARLEVRNGELWAVNVRWTPDGSARLSEKRQRYISPAFEADPETKRVTSVFNVAITALPATDDLTPLVAANEAETSMDEKNIKAAIEALKNQDGDSALAILEAMLVAGASGEPAADPAAEAPAMADAPPPAPAEEDEEETASLQAAASRLCRVTGRSTLGDALDAVEELARERASFEAERAAFDAHERRQLGAQIVLRSNGAIAGASVWADPTEEKPTKLAEPWASMPIAKLRDFVATLSPKPAAPKPPKGRGVSTRSITVEGHLVELSDEEVRRVEARAGARPEDRAAALERYAAIKLRQGRTAPVTLEG